MHFVLESIPSPSQGVWHLGFFPIRAYALCIIAGIFAAIWISQRRWTARGGKAGEIADLALWIVPMGIIGGRLYHVLTDHELYFGAGRNPWKAFAIWDGGLGIWGAIALPALGAIWVCRRRDIRVSSFGDVLAPALLVAQGLGRWGNYFNQELYGRPTKLPWGLEISPSHWPAGRTFPYGTTFHPTFLYESLWDLGGAGLVLWLDRRLKLGYGRCFALYVMVYTVGRFWIEALRIDVAANDTRILGLRFNDWTAIVCFAAAAVYFVIVGRKHRAPDTRPDSVYVHSEESGATEAPSVR
ncbi:MAG: prolipoprotein diacylglyceryl transferase [Marmoricola sp.]